MLTAIIGKELRDFSRRPGLVFVGVLGVVMLSMICVHSWIRSRSEEQVRLAAQLAARNDWLNQGNHDPHSAAHHGTDLYKPLLSLSTFDSGLAPALGTAIRLEAHHLHRPTNRPNENSVQLQQPLVLSPALALQILLPLLIVGLGFSSISREREEGTLALALANQGVWHRMLAAKSASLLMVAMLIASPVWLLLILNSCRPVTTTMQGIDVAARALLLTVCLTAFLSVWVLWTVGVSARFSSRISLAVLLGGWTFWTLIVPPLTLDLALLSNPLPSGEQVKQWQDDEVRYGDNGKNVYRRIYRELEEKLLKEYGVEKTSQLPINFEGASMLAAEEFSDALIDQGLNKIETVFNAHDNYLKSASFLSPYLAMRGVSMALCGTDRDHHAHFTDEAERYRRDLVRRLNQALTVKEPRGEKRPDRRPLWESIPEFQWNPPAWRDAVRSHAMEFVSLFLWLAIACGFTILAPSKVVYGE